MPAFYDLTGKVFCRLTVIGLHSKQTNGKRYRYYWLCRCECGNFCVARTDALTSGAKKSCGCLHKESAVENISKNHKHKKSHTWIYRVWTGMLQRCYNANDKSYVRYGGRGIKVCKEWRDDFQAFYDHVSELENFGEPGYTLDRIDVNGDYKPGNVRWATKNEQARNRRSNVEVEINGEKMLLIEASEKFNIPFQTLSDRLERGDTGERLVRPVGEDRIIARANAKLNLDIAREIRRLYATGKYTQKQLAKIFNVSRATIGLVVNNKIWKE